MPARDYKLCVSPLSGTVYISKVSKRNPNIMLDDRIEVDENTFLHQLEQYIKAKLKDGSDTIEVSVGDKVVMELKLNR
jgi:hypothetical protein